MNNKGIKKVIAIVLLFSLVLCGCGKKSDSEGESSRKTKTTKEDKGKKGGKKQTSKPSDKPEEEEPAEEAADASAESVNGWMVGFIDEIDRIVNTYDTGYGDTIFNLVDINGDDIPELVSFDSLGYWASISIYKDNNVYTQKLYDNSDKPTGFTDYGAYGAVLADENMLIKIERDSTFDPDGGWNLPGSEWLGIGGDAFDYYEYLTAYEMTDELNIEEISKYSVHYYYNEAEVPEYDEVEREGEFIEAAYNGRKISEDEYNAFVEKTWLSDVYFGSEQDRGDGLSASEMIELLSDESFVYEPGTIYKGTGGAQDAYIADPTPVDNLIVNTDNVLTIVSSEASSELNVTSKDNATYHVSNLYDGDTSTAWVEGVDGDGEGQTITLHLDGRHKISELKIYNGFLKTQRRYAINGKVKKVIIDYGNGYEQVSNVAIIYPPEEEVGFSLGEVLFTIIRPEKEVETDTIKITIVEATPGSQYHDTAISEIMIYGE